LRLELAAILITALEHEFGLALQALIQALHHVQ